MNIEHKISVTRPSLPSLEELQPYLSDIWESMILTNQGKFHEQFEKELGEYLGVKYISLFCNGTIALLTSIKALEIKGEVITTPYSFIATSHVISWAGLKPVFADILPDSWTLDPQKVVEVITPETTAILPVHTYGNPCQVEEFQKVAKKKRLKIIYDACHTFGEKIDNLPIVSFGDLSVMSFHATKVFTTFEGGAVISGTAEMKKKIDRLRNFGFTGETSVVSLGINGKLNEFQAAIGLLQLQKIEGYLQERRSIADLYKTGLKNVEGVMIPGNFKTSEQNFSYFPVFINEQRYGRKRDELYSELIKNNIFGRRYFYPLISQFEPYSMFESALPGKLPIAEKAAREVICLPVYPGLNNGDVANICGVIKHFSRSTAY